MFCRKTFYSKIEKIHYSNSVSIHLRHFRFFVTEIFKSVPQINAEFMWFFFKQKNVSYNLRKGPILNFPRTQSTYYGTNAIHFRASLVWNNLSAKVIVDV